MEKKQRNNGLTEKELRRLINEVSTTTSGTDLLFMKERIVEALKSLLTE